MTAFISAARLRATVTGDHAHGHTPGPADAESLVVLDCRFSLMDASAGRDAYLAGHIPGARHLDVDTDMSAPKGVHGGRHPLPSPADFAACLAERGIGPATRVVLYDASNYAFAARCWWMMRALGYPSPQFLVGGYQGWLDAGGAVQSDVPTTESCDPGPVPESWPQCCDREGLRQLQADGAVLVDAREAVRYRGEHEPIDPVAGHIPGAENYPWQGFVDEAGVFLPPARLQEIWGDRAAAQPLVVYCGSGVSACVNILALAELGRDDVWLYAGSWSDWCSYL